MLLALGGKIEKTDNSKVLSCSIFASYDIVVILKIWSFIVMRIRDVVFDVVVWV